VKGEDDGEDQVMASLHPLQRANPQPAKRTAFADMIVTPFTSDRVAALRLVERLSTGSGT
jgi:hypothetical protein